MSPAQNGTSKPSATQRAVLAATILGSSMAFIDGTVVNVALPALQTAFHASVVDVQWVVEAYALMLASLILVGGSLGDRLGRRRMYVAGVSVFAGSSVFCGLARNIHQLTLGRSIQGVGAALLIPGSLAMLTAFFPEQERGRAIGTWSGFTAISAAFGPVLGGWLIEHSTWRWIFLLNLPSAIAVLLLCMRIPESRNENAPRALDWRGALLVTLGLGAVTYALIEWPSRALGQGWLLLVAAALGVVCLGGFVAVELRATAPLVSFSLFRSRNFAGANLLTLLLYAALSGLMFFVPMDLIQVQHYTATQAGAVFLPFVILMFSLSRWAGGLVARFGSRIPLSIGPLVAALGIALFSVSPEGGSYWVTLFPAVLTMGLGMTISVAPLTTTVMNAVPTGESGLASGVNNAVSRLAALLAIALFGAVLVTVFNHSLDESLASLTLSSAARAQIEATRTQLAAAHSTNPAIQHAVVRAFCAGYRVVIWIGTALAASSAAVAWLLIKPEQR